MFKFASISLFDVVDGNNRAIRNEYILSVDYYFLDMFVSYSLDSVRNKPDCWMVV